MIARLLRLNNACNVGVCEFHGEGEYRVVDAGHEVVHARKSIDALSHRANRRVLSRHVPTAAFATCSGLTPTTGEAAMMRRRQTSTA